MFLLTKYTFIWEIFLHLSSVHNCHILAENMRWISNQIHNQEENSMNTTNENPISELGNHRQQLSKVEYSPIGSSRKLNLLLQRSLRYSYRQRCCGCCPTILCELLFPIILIALVILTRYGMNLLDKKINEDPDSSSRYNNHPKCSQNMNTSRTLSSDLLVKCFKFPPSYKNARWSKTFVSNQTNIIFQPMTNHTKQLAEYAQKYLEKINCNNNTKVW